MGLNTALAPNLVGLVALCATTVVLSRKSDQGLLVVTGTAVLLWALHYWLLGSWVGALTNLEGAAFIYVAAAMRRRGVGRTPRRLACAMSVLLLCLITVLFWRGVWDLLPLAGGVLFAVAQFLLDGAALRWGFISGESLFGAFSLSIGSAPGFLVALVNISAGLWGLRRQGVACDEATLVARA